jgi:hypothetical protein
LDFVTLQEVALSWLETGRMHDENGRVRAYAEETSARRHE